MDPVLFYHHWRSNVLDVDYSIWLHTDAPVRLISGQLPEKVVCQEAPHVQWVTPDEFAVLRARGGGVWVELPTCFHAPIGSSDAFQVPRGRGVVVAVFDFDWAYLTEGDNGGKDAYRIPPHVARLENRLADRRLWVEACVRPTWSFMRENTANLRPNQNRMLVGLSRVLGEDEVVAEVSPLCGWAQEIVDYDCGNCGGNNWLEARLDTLARGGDCGGTITTTPWHESTPTYRWLPRSATNEDNLFQLEARAMLRQEKLEVRPVFERVMRLENSHYFFIQEYVEHFPRLTGLEGCERGTFPSLFDPDFIPSSPGLVVCPNDPRWYIVNNRKVNYRILSNGAYVTIRGGQVSPVYNGISKNEFFFVDRETLRPIYPIRPMSEDAIPNKREEEVAIVGLEDVRLVREGADGSVLRFYATTKSHSYSGAIRIMIGRYDVERAIFCDTTVLHPPHDENPCEKNWAWCGDDRYIYRWHPLEIGSVRGDRLVVDECLTSPAYFREFRGSSPAVVWRQHHFFTVHSVAQRDNGRRYAHSLVVLDLSSEKHCVVGATPPFCFEDAQIEYNIGLDIYKGRILFAYSTRDSSSQYMRVPIHHLLDRLHYVDKDAEARFKLALYESDW